MYKKGEVLVTSSKVKMIVISDIHLETAKDGKRIAVLDALNGAVRKVRDEGFYPVVVCAGDVANGIKGYELLKHIETQVVYVAGNHEFWGGDFYEINKALISQAPPNVHYLYNKWVEIEDTIFAGSSLWTDVGLNTNPDVSYHCTHTMRDISNITAKKWYEKEQNLKRLEELYSKKNGMLDAAFLINAWNILVEREENQKTAVFFDVFAACVIEMKANKYDTLEQILEKKFVFSDILKLKADGYLPLIKKVWYGLEKVKDLENKKFVAVTHHLPFFEELSVGLYSKNSDESKNLPPFLNLIDKAWLNISSGENYGFENYFYNVSKGEFRGYDSIPKIFHYVNNGVRLFTEDVPKVFKNWVHGHEHNYAFTDYVKGIKICTSPMGHMRNVLFTDDDMVVRVSKDVSPEQKKEISNKIKRSFYEVTDPVKTTEQELIHDWCWYLLREQKLLSEISLYERAHTNKMKWLKKLWKEYLANARICPLLSENIDIYEAAQHSALSQILKILKEMKEAVALRKNENYSYLNSLSNKWNSGDNFDNILKGLNLQVIRVMNTEYLLSLNRNPEKKAMLSVKDVIKFGLSIEEDNFKNIKYLKYTAQYYAEAFKNLDVYDFSAFKRDFHLIRFDDSLKKRMINQSKKVIVENNFDFSFPKKERKEKSMIDKFFQ